MSESESLHRRVRRVINDSGDRDPRTLSERVLRGIPDEELRAALAEALPMFVRHVLMENRPTARSFPSVPPPAPPLPSPVPAAAALVPAFQAPGQAAPVGGVPHRPAARPRTRGFHGGARIREGWQRALDASVIGANGERKRLRSCTREDLDAIAGRLSKQADDAARRARGYRELARTLTEYNAETVDDLPSEVQMEMLGSVSS